MAPLGGRGALDADTLIVSCARGTMQLNGGNAAFPPGYHPVVGMAPFDPDETVTIRDPEGMLMRIVPGVPPLFCNITGHNLPEQFMEESQTAAAPKPTALILKSEPLNPKPYALNPLKG